MTTVPFILCGFDTSQLRAALKAYNFASKGQILPNGPFFQSGTVCCLQRLQSHIQHPDCFLPHLYIVLVRPLLPGIPTLSMSFPAGVASLTFLFPLWTCPSIFDGQRPYLVPFGFHRFHPICLWPMVLSLPWIWPPVPWYVNPTV